MDEQKRGLSVARLKDREKYYKDKALQLEKNFIFANEKISSLEEELDALSIERKGRDKELHETRQELKETKDLYSELQDKFASIVANNQTIVAELQDELIEAKKHVKVTNDSDNYDQKMESYERLLATIQLEMNEKDKELEHYKKRISVLEKRLKLGASGVLSEKPNLEELSIHQKQEVQAIVYLDFATILREQRSMVRGDLIIENIGTKKLPTPYICFRYSPGDASKIKGRIKTWETVETDSSNPGQWEWVFLDTDWAKEAFERGEIWIYPSTPITIEPSEIVTLGDWQIPIERKYYNQLTVEVFVFFEESNYRVKGANQIIINF